MTALSMLSQEEWKDLFNERNHNPPPPAADFGDEFDAVLDMIEPLLLIHAPSEEFLLWDKHNHTRFIDVAFESEAYLQAALVRSIQDWQRTLKEDWMVCLWMASWLFVTKDKVLCFAPTPDEPAFQAFLQDMSNP